jgi:amino acid transporter
MPARSEQQFLAAERAVEQQAAHLRKELRLTDLVLFQILYIVGIQWIGTAGKLGSAHIMYWVPAILLFYIPSGFVVAHLAEEMPLEGGIYQWAKLRLGDLAGFLAALNFWCAMLLLGSGAMVQINDIVAWGLGPSAAWMHESKAVLFLLASVVSAGITVLSIRGLATVKWLHNSGGFVLVVTFFLLTAFAIPRWLHHTAVLAPFAFTAPAVTLLNLNLLGRMAFGALCGFDGCAVFAGEVRGSRIARTLRNSIWIAAPLIALCFILGTADMIAVTRPADIDLIAPPMQAITRGAAGTPFAAVAPVVLAVLLLINMIGAVSSVFNTAFRLPMVAGWDHLLPGFLCRLHPRHRTPVGAILLIAAAILALTIAGNLGTGAQESFQIINTAGLVCWALTYLAMFAIPLIAPGEQPSLAVRIAGVSGFVMTLLYVVLSVFPIIDVKDPVTYALKTGGIVVLINAIGFWHFRRANRNRNSAARHAVA